MRCCSSDLKSLIASTTARTASRSSFGALIWMFLMINEKKRFCLRRLNSDPRPGFFRHGLPNKFLSYRTESISRQCFLFVQAPQWTSARLSDVSYQSRLTVDILFYLPLYSEFDRLMGTD